MERLDKFIADVSDRSRKDVKLVLRSGAVKVNNSVVSDAAYKIDPENDQVMVSGKIIRYRKNTYIMMNKPEGVVCSTRDGRSETVLSLVPEDLRVKGLFPAGRLDKDSKGFVFLTDDGALAHKMLSPKKHVAKYYLVKLKEDYRTEYETAFLDGLKIDGGEQCLPARVKGVEENNRYAFVELHEGKFHQVKRMFEAVENSVESLYRTQIGNLQIDVKLKPGDCLEILHNDVENLLAQTDFLTALNSVQKKFWAYLINNNL